MPRIALDTNVLAYSEGIERSAADAAKIVLSRNLLRALNLGDSPWIAPVQVFGELHHVLVRRRRLTPIEASARVRRLSEVCLQAPTSADVLDSALGLAADHGLQIYDALILTATAEARCELLLSEDLHDGFVWRGVTVTNPFGANPDGRLARLLS